MHLPGRRFGVSGRPLTGITIASSIHVMRRRLWLLVPLVVVSCDQAPSAPAGPATTRFLLTDAPFPYERLARADFYIKAVTVILASDTLTPVTVAEPRRRIDVLALQNGIAAELGETELPAGEIITGVRLVIDTDSSSITLRDSRVLTGFSTPGIRWQSVPGRRELPTAFHEPITIADTGTTVVIDFDLGRSFVPYQVISPFSTDSSFVFSPVLRAADYDHTGTISGYVHAHSATGAAVGDAALTLLLGNPALAPSTWTTIQTARTDSTGQFQFSIVIPTNWWRTRLGASQAYMVRADPPRELIAGPTIRPSVFVAARADTRIGTLVLP